MDKLQTVANKPIHEFINCLVSMQHYKPLPLVIHEAIYRSDLADNEKELLLSIYFKSDIYTHDIVYNKNKLAVEYKTSTRTIERRIAALTEAGWLEHDINLRKEPLIRFNVPLEMRQSMLTNVPRRTSGEQEKTSRTYIRAKSGERIFATYVNRDGSECIVWLEEGRAHIEFSELTKMLERLINHYIENGSSSLITSNSLFASDATEEIVAAVETKDEADACQQEDTSEVNVLEAELNGKLSNAEKELSMLSFVRNKTDFLAKASEIQSIKNELASVKQGREVQAKTAACGQLAKNPVITPETTTNLSQPNDKTVAILNINKHEIKNETAPCEHAQHKTQNQTSDNCDLVRFSAALKKQKGRGYHTKEKLVIPQQLKDKVTREVQRLRKAKLVSNAEMLSNELLFAIERQFVGKPKDKADPSFYDVMRFNTDVALRLVREGRWQSPTGVKEKYKFTVDKKAPDKIFRQQSPLGLGDIVGSILAGNLQ